MRTNIKKNITQAISLSIFIDLLLLVMFKEMRLLLPPPEIGKNKLVGFSQYFGYPFYYDTIYFLLLLLVPIVVFFFFSKKINT